MRNLLLLLMLSTCTIYAEEPVQPSSIATSEVHPYNTSRNLWRASIATLAVANALDVHSSWGKHELNSTLASANGTFGVRGALLKLGMQGSLMGFEYLITRGHPSGKLYRALSFINFGASAGVGAVAMHNYSIPRQPR